MSIYNRALCARLSNLEACAEHAPEGTFEQAKKIATFIHDHSGDLLRWLKNEGFKAGNDDRLRNLEVALYGYILTSNPDGEEFAAAEGFGALVDDPQFEAIKKRVAEDKAFLKSLALVRPGEDPAKVRGIINPPVDRIEHAQMEAAFDSYHAPPFTDEEFRPRPLAPEDERYND